MLFYSDCASKTTCISCGDKFHAKGIGIILSLSEKLYCVKCTPSNSATQNLFSTSFLSSTPTDNVSNCTESLPPCIQPKYVILSKNHSYTSSISAIHYAYLTYYWLVIHFVSRPPLHHGVHKKGGGIALCERSTYSVSIVHSSDPSITNSPEYAIFRVESTLFLLLLAIDYRPPASHLPIAFLNTLPLFLPHYLHVIVTGDFNINMTINNDNSTIFRRHFAEKALVLVDSPPTHHVFISTNGTSHHTWIDLFLIKDADRPIRYSKSYDPFTIGHDFISIVYSISNLPPAPLTITHRSLKNITAVDASPHLSELLLYLFPPPLPSVVEPSSLAYVSSSKYSADKLTNLITSAIRITFDHLAPVRTFTVSTNRKPWITPNIRRLMAQRRKLYKHAPRSPTSTNMIAYRTKRNEVCNALATAKNAFLASRINRAPSAAAKWRELHKLGIGKKTSLCPLLKFTADELNAHFAALLPLVNIRHVG